MKNEILINFQNASLRYNTQSEILKDINLNIQTGEFIFLTGESGSGKTSLLNMINLSIPPSRGKLEVLGCDANNVDQNNKAIVRRRIGNIFQNFKLIDNLNIFENIELPLKILKTPKDSRKKSVDELLNWINLTNYAKTYPKQLSGGQQQLVAIARAVITRPDIILADEPTGSIDKKMADKIMYLFTELNKQGIAILFATHSMDLLKQYDSYNVAKLEKNKLYLSN
jgi:cell division transport system ATP-binding protein